MYQVKIDWINENNDPVFHFKELEEAINFIKICFDNGYDVCFKQAEDDSCSE